jgi:hypothetical protein
MAKLVDPGPSRASFTITPNDTVTQLPIGRGIFVGVAGDVTGRLADDTANQTFTLAGGGVHPLAFQYVVATGTTATQLKVVF